MGVSSNGGTPISHPKNDPFLVGKPRWLLGKPTILGTPPQKNRAKRENQKTTNSHFATLGIG